MQYRINVLLSLLLAVIVGACSTTKPAQEDAALAPLLDGMGDHHMPISTDDATAQEYFDQGLTLAYGFNHAEAARSFREAQRLDPDCAMCYWGEALVLGPNINAPMDPAKNPAAWSAVQRALQHATPSNVTEKERALIEALSHRYAENAPEDRSALDKAYADAMRPVAAAFPNDADVQALFAEALMDTTPWDYWQADDTPMPVTVEFTAALDAAIAQQADHPGANHLYIHAVEAVHPDRGLPSAERLEGLVPGAGHLVHMPSHIYIRVGRYRDAVRVNQLASAADERYIAQCRAQGFYPLLYYPHNLHFLWFAAMMGGEGDVAINAAERIQASLSDEVLIAQRVRPTLIFALVRFEKWSRLLELPAPPEEQLYVKAMWHYARGLALLNTARPEAAMAEIDMLASIAEREAIKPLEQSSYFGAAQIRIAHHILEGERAGAHGDHNTAIDHLRTAVELQDELPYMEPPYWYYPVRQTLGHALLEAGRPAEAEMVFREDLAYFAENGWSLHGLATSLRAQGKTAEADDVTERFEAAWEQASIKLTSAQH